MSQECFVAIVERRRREGNAGLPATASDKSNVCRASDGVPRTLRFTTPNSGQLTWNESREELRLFPRFWKIRFIWALKNGSGEVWGKWNETSPVPERCSACTPKSYARLPLRTKRPRLTVTAVA